MRIPMYVCYIKKKQTYAEDIQKGLEGVELLDDNDLGFQVRLPTASA